MKRRPPGLAVPQHYRLEAIKSDSQKKWLGEVVEDAPEEMGVVPPLAAADLVAAAPTVADLIRQVSRKNLTATYSILENGLPQI